MTGPGAHLSLYEERCDRCGRCRGVCPRGALKVGSAFIYIDWRVCDGCLQCVQACDRNAIVARVVPRRTSTERTDVELAEVSKVVVGSRAEAKAVRKAAEKAAKDKKSVKTRATGPLPVTVQPAVLAADGAGGPLTLAAEQYAPSAPVAPFPPAVAPPATPVAPGQQRRRSEVPRAAKPAARLSARVSFPTSGSLVAWSWTDVIIVLAIMLLSLAAKNAVLALPQVALMPQLGRMSLRIAVLTFYYIVQIAGFGWVAGRYGMPAMRSLGLSRGDDQVPGPSALGSAGLVIALFLASEAITVAYGLAMQALHVAQPAVVASDLTVMFGSGPVGIALAALLVAVAAPFAEEIALRGVVLPALGDRFGMWPGILGSALLYALFHASVWMFVPMFAFGIALGWLVWTRRSLWPAVALHVLFNGTAVAAAFLTAK